MEQFEPITEKFTTAKEFLDALRNLKESKIDPLKSTSPWVFRGHYEAEWKLMPSAWRCDGKAKLEPLVKLFKPKIENLFKQTYSDGQLKPDFLERTINYCIWSAAEIYAVRSFCDLADELGYEIPDADKVLGFEEISDSVFNGRNFAHQDFIDIPFSFAQHHGIPTRYLDWTASSEVASFFAADHDNDDQSLSSKHSGSMCVWATNANQQPITRITWVSVPRSKHNFLHAQHGLFSFSPLISDYFLTNEQWPSFEAGIADLKNRTYPVFLYKFLLPITEAQSLLKLLYCHKISRMHLKPTFDNVTKSALTTWKWTKLSSD